MFKVGDKVRFVTNDPRYSAAYDECDMLVVLDESDDVRGPALRVEYVNSYFWGNMQQWVHPEDVKNV